LFQSFGYFCKLCPLPRKNRHGATVLQIERFALIKNIWRNLMPEYSKPCPSCKHRAVCICQYDDIYPFMVGETGICPLYESRVQGDLFEDLKGNLDVQSSIPFK
jgi:hypothetical protein